MFATNVCMPALWIHLPPPRAPPASPGKRGQTMCVCESERAPNSILGYLSAAVFFFSPPAQSFLQHQSGGSLRAEEDAPLVLLPPLPLDWLVVKRSG